MAETVRPVPRTTDRTADRSGRQLPGFLRRPVFWLAVALTLAYFVVPEKGLATQILVFGLYATSFNLLLGYAGLLSFGHATYFGLGAYGTGLVMKWWNPHVLVAMTAGVVLASVAAVIIGWFCLRRRQVYFSMLTLAFTQMVFFVFQQSRDITGGDDGLRNIPIADFDVPFFGSIPLEGLRHPENRYFFVLIVVVLSLILIQRIVDSPFGRVLQSIRESEERAKALGYPTDRILLLAFVFSGAFAGLAGALWALLAGFVGLETLSWLWAGDAVLMTIVGGAGSFVGPFIGAAVFQSLREYVSRHEALLFGMGWQFYTGVIFMACVLFFPDGIWGTLKQKLRRRAGSRPRVQTTATVEDAQRAAPTVSGGGDGGEG
ncbi:MAG TPA: branched-chain amino acid ABC transporter permease [Chloroflexota bacterium]|nr:branched-chain amino acid ABC transporter permease [Chloroflexota bacterium]